MSEILHCPECKKESTGGYIICEDCYEQLLAQLTRLQKRDCNATIQLCFNDGDNPFARENLQVVDVGVSDNCYVVESQTVKQLQTQLTTAKEENKRLRDEIRARRQWQTCPGCNRTFATLT